MPFITEELWHVLRAQVRADAWPDSVLAAEYPRAGAVDDAADRGFGPVIGIVDAIRNIRGEMNIAFKTVLDDVEIGALDREAVATVREELGRVHRLANVSGARVLDAGRAPARRGASAVAVGAGFEVRVGLAGAVDLAAEAVRISKEIAKIENDVAGLEQKLANPSFVAKAPAEVVEKDRARLAELVEKKRKLEAHRDMLSAPELDAARRHTMETMENQNEQKPTTEQPSSSSPTAVVQQAADQVQTAVAGAMEKVVSTATEIAKAASSAVVSGIEAVRERTVAPKKKAARKPAKKAAPKKAAAKKAVAKKAPARKAAARGAKKAGAKRTAKAPARKTAAKKGGRKTAARRGKK